MNRIPGLQLFILCLNLECAHVYIAHKYPEFVASQLRLLGYWIISFIVFKFTIQHNLSKKKH